MRSAGQPPADRIVRVFPTCPVSPLTRRHDGFSLDSPRKRVLQSLKPVQDSQSCDHSSRTLQCPAALFPAPKSRSGGGRKPGQPVALSAFPEVSPGNSFSRITGCCWPYRSHLAVSGTLTFRWTHSLIVSFCPQDKKRPPLCRSCGRRDFPVDTRGNLRFKSRSDLASHTISTTCKLQKKISALHSFATDQNASIGIRTNGFRTSVPGNNPRNQRVPSR